MPRLFVAIDLPEAIRRALQPLCTGLPGARWASLEQIHLTLRFIGDANPDQIQQALQPVSGAPIDLHLQGVGQFPPRGQPRVLWVGVQAGPPLFQLQSQISRALNQVGVPPEDRPFAAHITLTRFKTPPVQTALRAYFERHRDFSTPPFTVGEFILYSSQLTPNGSIYRRESVYPLRAT